MHYFVDWHQAGADRVAVYVLPAYDTDDRGVRFRADPPDVKVCNPGIPRCLDQLAHFIGNVIVGRVE
jgi:hypothetical protein